MKKKVYILIFSILVVFSTRLFANPLKTRGFSNSSHKFGIIDDGFNIIIPAEYLYAKEFTGKVANVKLDKNTWGFVNKDNELLFSLKVESLNPLIDGWARYKDFNGLYGFVNEKGEYLIKDCSLCYEFSEGYATFLYKDADPYWSFINTKGEKVFPNLTVKYVRPFCDGFAIVGNPSGFGSSPKFGLINHDGELVVPYTYMGMVYRNEHYWSVNNPEDETECFLINEKGERVSKTPFKTASGVYKGISYVTLKGEMRNSYRRYDIKNDVIDEIYSPGYVDVSYGKILVEYKRNDKGIWECTARDYNGNQICDTIFDSFGDQYNLILSFIKDNRYYYVNSDGKLFLPD